MRSRRIVRATSCRSGRLLLPIVLGLVSLTLPTAGAHTTHRCFGEPATIVGTEFSDTGNVSGVGSGANLDGTEGPDVIVGLGGSDSIDGKGGDDLICAGAGDDDEEAADGRAAITGGAGNDRIRGGPGRDTLQGSPGRDQMYGNADNDTLTDGFSFQGFSGPDSTGGDDLYGGPGSDHLLATVGNDRLFGGPGNDRLNEDPSWFMTDTGDPYPYDTGRDVYRGGRGDDNIYAFDTVSGNDLLDGNRDTDGCRADPGDVVRNCEVPWEEFF